MTVWILMHKRYARHTLNTGGWVDTDRLSDHSLFVRSVRAFPRRKDAINYLKERRLDNLEPVAFDVREDAK